MNQYYINADTTVSNSRLQLLKAANFVFFLLCIGFNFLAQALPLNRKSTGELSDQYPNLFTPAPLTFAIWSVIYSSLFLFVLWQVWPLRSLQRKQDRNVTINALGWDFVAVCVLNMAWLFFWHYEFVAVSVVIMGMMLLVLIRINRLVFRGLRCTQDLRNFLQIPFGLNLGWISVATVANVTAFLVGQGWHGGGFSEKIWTVAMMTVATLLAVLVVYNWRNIPYALAVTWALAGIALKHQEVFGVSLSLVIVTAYAGILVLLITIAVHLRPWWNRAINNNVYPPTNATVY